MSRLEKAQARLDKAVERLQAAVGGSPQSVLKKNVTRLEGSLAAARRERDGLRGDLAGLKSDQERLSAALHDAQESYAAMQVVNEAVAGRLDGAIDELKQLLEG